MPRVNSLDPAQNQMRNLVGYIRMGMRLQKISQKEMGDILGVTQSAFSHKLSDESLTAYDLLRIFERLGSTKEEAGGLMVQ